jgi:hypothetical protein
VVTLRELGLGLEDVRRVLDKQASLAEAAAAPAQALDVQIRTLRRCRAALFTVAKRWLQHSRDDADEPTGAVVHVGTSTEATR